MTKLTTGQAAELVPSSDSGKADTRQKLSGALEKFWGFDQFRPLQFEAMQAVMEDRDSLTVFPTGGGKSLCFQAPAVCRDGLGIVVSPLISLMKDQVDALRTCGIEAAVWNSSLSQSEERQVLDQVRSGELRLLYLAPERLLTDRTNRVLGEVPISFFAVDEAHCVSEWGHDFRPEYRGLKALRTQYPGVAIHAYTATATEQVRTDIVLQLGMNEAQVLVGSMDRPNLNYQIRRRQNGIAQIAAVVEKHPGDSGIVYCISRKNVEDTSFALNAMGVSALPYHAGMSPEDRKQNQESFLREEVDVIVATVAFGMGIDKSNVRYVIHASMPKSLEAYQQESGRAGRDGLDAECWMFFGGGDYVTWKRLIDQSESPTGRDGALQALKAIGDFTNGVTCRHVALAAHFGEQLNALECGACDVCLDDLDLIEQPLILAQKLISCVHRVEQRFGADYVAQVLVGSRDKRILQNGHDKLSTYALLESDNKKDVRNWLEQLTGQGFLNRAGEYNVLEITESGRELLKGHAEPRLTRPVETAATASKAKKPTSWEGVDMDLFEQLRDLRGSEAIRREVPAYVVFSDASIRDMARRRPSTLQTFRLLHGVGQKKLDDFGQQFLDLILKHCDSCNLATDVKPPPSSEPDPQKSPASNTPNATALRSFELFDQQLSLQEVAKKIERAESTTRGYLIQYILARKITDAQAWVSHKSIDRIRKAASEAGTEALKPIFVALNEEISYDEIRIVVACLKNRSIDG